MLVKERIVEDKPRLDFKYRIQSGPTQVKSYGISLARCVRFPTSLIDRAEELVGKIQDETLIDAFNVSNNESRQENSTIADETLNETNVTQEMSAIDKDVVDLDSYILLLMSLGEKNQTSSINIEIVNDKVAKLAEKTSESFRDLINNSSPDEILGILNSSCSSVSSVV